VKVDLGGDGFAPLGDAATADTGVDADGDGVLDENELVVLAEGGDVDGSDVIDDLVLQTTFDEWEDVLASGVGGAQPCSNCHMPPGTGPIVDDAPGGLGLPDRTRHAHTFVGVDYDLTPGHYAALGVGGGDALEEVLTARQRLVRSGVDVGAEAEEVVPGVVFATVTVTPNAGGIGHNFPTGFAFARQWWLEVTARTADGDPVCLLPVDPFTTVPGSGIASPCGSGVVGEQEDLRQCDPQAVAQAFGTTLNATVTLLRPFPLADCDPWLTNFQKILTDGDPERDGTFAEVPYQSLQPDIVKDQIRVSDQQRMVTLTPYEGPNHTRSFTYAFDVSGVPGQDVTIDARLRLRHLPPYFVRALDGRYPDGLTAEVLLGQMRIAEVGEASAAVTVG
jgi:hypothetical protein